MFLRFLAVLALLPYCAWLIARYRFHFIDHVNLAIHETGHLVFSGFGTTLHALGGTLLQLMAPAAFALNFALRGRRFDAWVCVFWLAESLMYGAWYLADAYLMQLPLVGGDRHDWNFLLSRWDLTMHAEQLGAGLHACASALALVATLGAGACVVREWQHSRRAREPFTTLG